MLLNLYPLPNVPGCGSNRFDYNYATSLSYTNPTEGSLWKIPAHDGTARKIAAADGVAVAPNGKDLVVSLVEKAGVRLVRIPLQVVRPTTSELKAAFRSTQSR